MKNPKDIRVLIACEESQAVCIEFRKLGFNAFSCDIQECSGGHPEWHIQGDAIAESYSGKYDLIIGHPPCTYLSGAGLHWCNVDRHGDKARDRIKKREDAVVFFFMMWNAPVRHICLENPSGHLCNYIKHTQLINPTMFGDCENKRTLLYLNNLPLLQHSSTETLFYGKTHTNKPKPIYIDVSGKKRYFTDAINRTSKARSKTFPGIAKAMATQWGEYLLNV